MKIPKVADIIGIINKIAPQQYAEEWDNVGLQLGDASSQARKIMVALDPGKVSIEAAVAAGCQLLLVHHPLIFSPLKKIVASDPLGADISYALKHGLAIAALHTNLDIAAGGVNDLLAARLGLTSLVPLRSTGREELVKLIVFIPSGHEEQILERLYRFTSSIGNYDECSFRVDGTGTFRPKPGAMPAIGVIGRREQVTESRVEILLARKDVASAITTMRELHPYEEPAYDIYPLLNGGDSRGLGRMGVLPEQVNLKAFAEMVKDRLQVAAVRFVGPPDRGVKKIAICGGSGMSLLKEAVFQGADVLLTGDIKYHEARHAEAMGMPLVDAGHFATEILMVEGLTDRLRNELGERRYEVEVVPFNGEKEPFSYI